MAGTLRASIRTLCLSSGSTVRAYRALQQTGVSRAYVGEHLSQRGALGRLQLKVMVANRTREIRPSGMKRGACGNVGVMGAGLRPIGKSMESPPDPTMLRAPHFYPNQEVQVPPPRTSAPKEYRSTVGVSAVPRCCGSFQVRPSAAAATGWRTVPSRSSGPQ